MILVDHGSTDSTQKILQKLWEEGLPIILKHQERYDHNQSEYLTKEMRSVTEVFQADWIIPLDADEFLSSKKNIREILSGLPCDRLQKIMSKLYIPDESNNPNFFERMTHRRTIESEKSASVIIPRCLAKKQEISIAQGNHNLLINGRDVEAEMCDELWLAHFPYRSPEQAMKKIIAGWPRTVAGFGKNTHQAFHWKELYEKILSGYILQDSDLKDLVLNYPRIGREHEKQELVEDAFDFPLEIAKKIQWKNDEKSSVLQEASKELLSASQAHYVMDQESREQKRYIDELERRLDGILKSKSWRWTQWVRNIEAWLFQK